MNAIFKIFTRRLNQVKETKSSLSSKQMIHHEKMNPTALIALSRGIVRGMREFNSGNVILGNGTFMETALKLGGI